jgi:D-3-phosphoglycerate dehydrogenase
LAVRHADEVGVLAAVLSTLRESGVNVQKMENVIFAGGHAACARIQIEGSVEEERLSELHAHPAIFSVKLLPL